MCSMIESSETSALFNYPAPHKEVWCAYFLFAAQLPVFSVYIMFASYFIVITNYSESAS